MNGTTHDRRIDYIEFASTDLEQTKAFYGSTLGWTFEDYGPDYTAFQDGRISGGFFKSDSPTASGALVVIYSTDLEEIESQIVAAGGSIAREIFAFPGGRRFHFRDPTGNELAVWSDR